MLFLEKNLKLILEIIFLLFFFLSQLYIFFLSFALIIIILDYKYFNKRKFIFIIIIVFSIIYIFLFQSFFFKTDLKSEQNIEIKVKDNLKIKEEYISFETKYLKKNYQVIYFGDDLEQQLKYGDVLAVKIKEVKKIENQFNNKGSFNSVDYFKSKKIRYQIQLSNISYKKSNPNLIDKIKNIRMNQIKKVQENIPKNYYLINSLVFGEKKEDDKLYDQIKNIGIIQLFTISGLHISFLVIVIERFLKIFKIQQKNINIILCFILIIYTPLSGGGNSVKRAVVMFLIATYFYYVEKEVNKIYIWLLSMIFFILLNPFIILNIGFILTYLITLFLILNKDFLSNATIKEEIYFNYFVTMFIFPITVNLNYSFNLLLPFLLLIYNKLIYILLTMSFLIVLCINIKANIVLIFIKLIFSFLTRIFLLLNNISELSTIKIHHYSYIFIIIYMYFYLRQLKEYYLFKDVLNKSKKQFLIVVILLSININIIGTVDIIDIGQGDAIFIQKPLSYNILIDTGPEKSQKELERFLDYKGINKIDNLIVTHNHEDHQGSFESIIKDYNIGKIYLNNNTYLEFKELLSDYNYKIIDGFYKNKLGYFYTSSINSSEENNNSIVFLTNLGLKKWMFMGDAEKELESEIINKYNIDVDYLKIGHHGSKTSTTQELLDNTTPKEVFISSGRKNKYNHPNKEVIDRLEKNKIKYKNTQFDYQITKYYI